MAVYEPSLMLQGDWTILSVMVAVSKTLLAVMLWASAITGYWKVALTWSERLGAVTAACLIVAHFPWSDEIGAVLAVLLALRHWRRAAKA